MVARDHVGVREEFVGKWNYKKGIVEILVVGNVAWLSQCQYPGKNTMLWFCKMSPLRDWSEWYTGSSNYFYNYMWTCNYLKIKFSHKMSLISKGYTDLMQSLPKSRGLFFQNGKIYIKMYMEFQENQIAKKFLEKNKDVRLRQILRLTVKLQYSK